jgi:hypothetical protein
MLASLFMMELEQQKGRERKGMGVPGTKGEGDGIVRAVEEKKRERKGTACRVLSLSCSDGQRRGEIVEGKETVVAKWRWKRREEEWIAAASQQ